MKGTGLFKGCEIEKVAAGPPGCSDLFEVRIPIRLTHEELELLEKVTQAMSWIQVRHFAWMAVSTALRKSAEDLFGSKVA
jgi:hypothetical protein